jgi:hypothetical protein
MKHSILIFLLACQPVQVNDDTGEPSTNPDTDTDTDTDTNDTNDTNDTTPGPVDGFGNLSADLHDEHESVVLAGWEQDESGTVHIEYSFENDEWHSTPSYPTTAGNHAIPLLGIPYEMDVQWRLVVESADTFKPQSLDGEAITTEDYPNLPEPVLVNASNEPDQWLESGNYLLTSINSSSGGWTGGTYWTVIYDREGRLVWAQKAPQSHWTLFAQVAVSGDHILWDEATYWSDWDGGAGSTVHRVHLDSEIDEISTPGLHHAFVQLPDETLVWGSQNHGGGEALVEQAMGSTNEQVLWTCNEDWANSGNCESNGLFYVESTNSFLYSFYTNNSLVEVSRDTGESMWWAGDVRNGYEFDPADSEFEWQHGVSYTETGTLLVSTEAVNNSGYTTMVREYTVDHDSETLTEVWNFDPDVYAGTNGDAWRLENGNTLHVIGSAGHVVEVNPDSEVIWHLNFGDDHLMGRGEFINDLYTLAKGSY